MTLLGDKRDVNLRVLLARRQDAIRFFFSNLLSKRYSMFQSAECITYRN